MSDPQSRPEEAPLTDEELEQAQGGADVEKGPRQPAEVGISLRLMQK
jgi:hypothetical protein